MVDVGVGWLMVCTVIGVRLITMASVAWRVAVIGLSGMRWFIFSDKAAEVVGANQFFYFILKRLAFIGGVAIIFVIFVILGHINVGGFKVLRGGGMRSAWSASSRRHDLGTLNGAYLVNRGCLGSQGLDSSCGDDLSGLVEEGV